MGTADTSMDMNSFHTESHRIDTGNVSNRQRLRYSAGDILWHNIASYDRVGVRARFTFPLESLDLKRHFRPQGNILDYGCGIGRAFKVLTQCRPSELWACDASSTMCEIASRESSGVQVRWVADPRAPNLPESFFDGILLVGVLSSVVPSIERQILVDSLAKYLRPDGILAIGDFGRSRSSIYIKRYSPSMPEPYTFLSEENIVIHHLCATELNTLVSKRFAVTVSSTMQVRTTHGNLLPGHVLIARPLSN